VGADGGSCLEVVFAKVACGGGRGCLQKSLIAVRSYFNEPGCTGARKSLEHRILRREVSTLKKDD
jgi:hypothetical protein